MAIDTKKLRQVAEKINAEIDSLDHAAFEIARGEYRSYTHPDTVLALLDEIDALRKDAERMAWQPIETAPAEGKFLVYMPDEDRQPIQVARWYPKVKVIGGNFAFDMPKPTHWMPLPDAPKVDAALALRESGNDPR